MKDKEAKVNHYTKRALELIRIARTQGIRKANLNHVTRMQQRIALMPPEWQAVWEPYITSIVQEY